jgi:hypothetical protein
MIYCASFAPARSIAACRRPVLVSALFECKATEEARALQPSSTQPSLVSGPNHHNHPRPCWLDFADYFHPTRALYRNQLRASFKCQENCSWLFLNEWGSMIRTSSARKMPPVRLTSLLTKSYSHACVWSCRWSLWWVDANERVHIWLDVSVLPDSDCVVWRNLSERTKCCWHWPVVVDQQILGFSIILVSIGCMHRE